MRFFSVAVFGVLIIFSGFNSVVYSAEPAQMTTKKSAFKIASPPANRQAYVAKTCWEELLDKTLTNARKRGVSFKPTIGNFEGDIFKEKVLQAYGRALLAGNFPWAASRLIRFQKYQLHLSTDIFRKWDSVFAEYLSELASNSKYASCRKEGIQALLNPMLLVVDTLLWTKNSNTQRTLARFSKPVLEVVHDYPKSMGLHCYDVVTGSMGQYSGAAMVEFVEAVSQEPHTRLGDGACRCADLASTGFCGCEEGETLSAGYGDITNAGRDPSLWGLDELENEDEASSKSCNGNGEGGFGRLSGCFGIKEGCHEEMARCSKRSRVPPLSSGQVVRPLGTIDPSCGLTDSSGDQGQQENSEQAAGEKPTEEKKPTWLERAINWIKAVVKISTSNPDTKPVTAENKENIEKAISRIQTGQVKVETRPEGTGAEGVSGRDRLSLTEKCQSRIDCAVHEIGHVAGLSEKDARKFAKEVTGSTGQMPGPDGGECSGLTEEIQAQMECLKEFMNCTTPGQPVGYSVPGGTGPIEGTAGYPSPDGPPTPGSPSASAANLVAETSRCLTGQDPRLQDFVNGLDDSCMSGDEQACYGLGGPLNPSLKPPEWIDPPPPWGGQSEQRLGP